jgi:lipoprotein-releasing system permease protein
LNTPYFIARRISSMDKNSFSRPIVRIAIIGIALGLSVMIISMAVVRGFQYQISDKVIGFGAHIQINKYDFNTSFEANPISINQDFYPSIDTVDGIKHIQVYAYKPGIIKTYDEIQGVVLKGVGADFDWTFFEKNVSEGRIPNVKSDKRSLEVIISKFTADKLNLKIGDDLRMYFISPEQKNMRARKFQICGIYETGLFEFDKQFVIGDIRQIQRLNKWKEDEIGGFEILLEDFDRLHEIASNVYSSISYDLNASNIKNIYPQIFDWLALMDVNVNIILALMVLVAGITMISILLILIIERTSMIGILKALGGNNLFVRKVFLYKSFTIVLYGLFWGNLVGVGFCVLQYYFGFIQLDQESYYVSVVPIDINIITILLLNFGTAVISTLMLVIPSMIIGRVQPSKAIRFS